MIEIRAFGVRNFWGKISLYVQGMRGYIYVVLKSTLQQEVITQLFWNKPPLPYQVQIENDWSLYCIN